jgi:hypothetical protein
LGEFSHIGRIFAYWANFCILGEFSHIGRIFAYWAIVYILWAIILQVTEAAHIFSYVFPQTKWCIDFDTNGLGYILGDFFANSSSGHPAGK